MGSSIHNFHPKDLHGCICIYKSQKFHVSYSLMNLIHLKRVSGKAGNGQNMDMNSDMSSGTNLDVIPIRFCKFCVALALYYDILLSS